jgi:2-methylisocitrate lyase-like PEP mutase family enzyme
MTKTEILAALHVPGDPLILFNVWDAGSAVAVARAGAKAIATGSASVAGANGLDDGETVPLELVLANAARIAASVELPVTIDFEGGYGATAADVERSVAALGRTGAVGLNLEDQRLGGAGLHAIDHQCARIAAAAASGLWVNARTDLFIQADRSTHNRPLLNLALERASAYAAAGARSFFAPLLTDPALIGDLCRDSPLPVNIMAMPGCPDAAELARLGVARISHGPGPWRAAMAFLEDEAKAAFNP